MRREVPLRPDVNWQTTAWRCNRCSAPITLTFNPDCPMEWLDMLLKSVWCNPCGDRRVAEDRGRSSVHASLTNWETGKIDEARLRVSLETSTRAWCKSLSVPWNLEIINQIVQTKSTDPVYLWIKHGGRCEMPARRDMFPDK